MPTIAKTVQLQDAETGVLQYPLTIAAAISMTAGGQTLLEELAKYMPIDTYTEVVGNVRKLKVDYIPQLPYLLKGANSVTDSPYVQEVSVNAAGTKLIVKTWSKEANGILKTEEIDIVGENTTYTLEAKYNDASSGTPNSAIRLKDSNNHTDDVPVPVGALRNDNNVTLILDGNFS